MTRFLSIMALIRNRAVHAGFAALLAGLLALGSAGCRTEAQDRDFDFNNPVDPNQDTGDSTGDETGQLGIVLVDSVSDVVVIINSGTEPTLMDNWTLENEDGSSKYTFTGFTLLSAGFVRIHSDIGSDTSLDKYTGSSTPNWGLSSPNSIAIIRNDSGTAIDSCASNEVCWE